MKNFSVIAAADEKWGIGKDGKLAWHYNEDFVWFRKMTMGTTCFMGRTTYEELATLRYARAELLPGRKCVVFSSKSIDDPRITVCNDISRYEDFTDNKENFFIGGTSIFEFGLRVADYVYLTAIPGDYDCNVQFPHQVLNDTFNLNREIPLSEELKVNVYERKQS